MAIGYSLVEWFLYRERFDPIPAPFLRIPNDSYYAWATLFGAPTIIGGWLVASALIQLIPRAAGGSGRFEDLATALAWATGVATVFSLLPDLATSAFGVYGAYGRQPISHVTQLIFLSLYLLAFLVLYSSSIRVVHALRWRLASVIGVGGFLVYQTFIFLFLR
jgi:hypothetical protein